MLTICRECDILTQKGDDIMAKISTNISIDADTKAKEITSEMRGGGGFDGEAFGDSEPCFARKIISDERAI